MNELHISRLVLVSFALTILAGALLLMLPVSRQLGVEPVSWVDALFTSTSAVCVTGLATRDTGTTFSVFGQGVILMLIQVGGLGFLTLSTFFITRILGRGKNIGLQHRLLLETSHGALDSIHPGQLLGTILLFTLVTEALGAVLLFLRFSQGNEPLWAVWLAVFHAISAFCNAGFGLYADSLMGYRDDPLVNGVVMGLIVLGGIGFLVVADLTFWMRSRLRRRPARLSLHTRMVLRTTLWLIGLGALFIAALEWGGEAMGSDAGSVGLASLFLSVTSRTAGFNTVDTGLLTGASLYLVILLMAIGGSPGSTAGGMKTTTFAVCVALMYSRARNRPRVECQERSIPDETVTKAMFVVTGYVLAILAGSFLLEVTEAGRVAFGKSSGNHFLALLFEVVSAIGTVGLSTGITGSLSVSGKLIITALMFIGRLGPLLVVHTLVGSAPRVRYAHAEENVNIG
ncbi:MAG: hypothetical protein HQL56_09245 [Magnetococcales bacterium]|nr:hypothetical protein [Magnetococcales bacterium]